MKKLPMYIALENSTHGSHRIALECAVDNELTLAADGWAKLTPYGDFPKARTVRNATTGAVTEERYLQRFDKAAAQALVNEFNTLGARVKRFFVGTPIFAHHPDVKVYQPHTVTAVANDTSPKGVVAAVQARDDGFYAQLTLLPDGRQAVENDGLKYTSPFWWVEATGETVNGQTVVRPTALISVGLTAQPNIPGGDALANHNPHGEGGKAATTTQAATDEKKENIMEKALLIALLNMGGLALANNASDADIAAGINTLSGRAKSADALTAEKTTLDNEKNAVATERDTLKTALANERKRAGDLAIQLAQERGALPPADLNAAKAALANEATYEAEIKRITELPKVMNTKSKTVEIAGTTVNLANEREVQARVLELVSAKQSQNKGMDYTTAFNAVKAECPALFDGMTQPEAQS